MSGVLGWMGDALGFGDDENPPALIHDVPDPLTAYIDGGELDEVEIFPDNMVTKDNLYNIFASFKAAVDSETGKARLAKAVEAGDAVEDVTQQIQEEVATKLGLDGKATTDQFKYVLKFYKDDEVLCEEFVKFCESESLACDEAELGPDKLKAKLARLDLNEAAAKKQPGAPVTAAPSSRTDTSPPTANATGPGLPWSSGAGGTKNMPGGVHPAQIKQLEMLLAPPEEFEEMLRQMEVSMGNMIGENPRFKQLVAMQLKARGLEGWDDPIAASIAQCREAHDLLRKELHSEAEKKGVPYEQEVKSRIETMKQRMQHGASAMADVPPGGAQPPPGMGQPPPGMKSMLRFNIGDKVEARVTPEGKYAPGVISGTMISGGQHTMAYQITLDDGQGVYAPGDADFYVRAPGSTGITGGHGSVGGGGAGPMTQQPGAQTAQPTAQAGAMSGGGVGRNYRFGVGERVECRVTPEGQYAAGTITMIGIPQPGRVMPYQIQLDAGQLIIAPEDSDFYIRRFTGAVTAKAGTPLLTMNGAKGYTTNQPGAQNVTIGPEQTMPGGIVNPDHNPMGLPSGPPPGMIERPKKGTPLRFGVGESVMCRVTPEGQFAPGRVIQQWYREPNFPPDVFVPYQIQLANGMMIFAPADQDAIIRAQ